MDGKLYFKDPFFKRVRIPLQIDSNDPTVKATKAAAAAIEEGGKVVVWTMLVLNLFFG
jgi:hypothetical protein